MAYLQHSSKTIQTITHSNIDGFPKDAVTTFGICNHLRMMRMSMKPLVFKEEYLALGKNLAEGQHGHQNIPTGNGKKSTLPNPEWIFL